MIWPVGRLTFHCLQRVFDFVDADLVGGQRVRIHLHMDGVLLRAQHLHLRDAGDHGDALGDAAFGEFVERPQGHLLGRQGDVENRLIGRIDLGEGGRRGHARGQLAGACVMAACTSMAAPSMLRLRSNSSVICVDPSELMEVIDSIPAMVENWFSSGVATEVAMVSGIGAGQAAVT